LTPNAFTQLGVFDMAMKMLGYELLADTFVLFYKTQLHRKKVRDSDTGEEVFAEFGSYNFVSMKTRGTVRIILTYRNKWLRWADVWFYHQVCTDFDVKDARANGLAVHVHYVLEATITAYRGFRWTAIHSSTTSRLVCHLEVKTKASPLQICSSFNIENSGKHNLMILVIF